MPDNNYVHATLVELGGKGVLLLGSSGSGKSDLALRLIENKGAKLVADDVVRLRKSGDSIYGFAADNICGKLEVRGIGIVDFPYVDKVEINLAVHLSDIPENIERLPLMQKESILGLEIKKIDLYAKENSAPDKIVVALRQSSEE